MTLGTAGRSHNCRSPARGKVRYGPRFGDWGPRTMGSMSADDPAAEVVAGYDRLASRWDQWADAVEPPLRERYVEWLEARLEPGSKVLELGGGTGRPVALRLARHHQYLGVDASSEMVRLATRNVPDARFLVADMRHVELPASEFAAVVAFHAIIHVPRADHAALFSKIHRWLQPDGYFLACLSSGDLPWGWEDDWLGGGPMFWSGYDADTNQRLLTEAGFRIIEASVVSQTEGEEEVRFQWIRARAASAIS